jgi:hypothetical protein
VNYAASAWERQHRKQAERKQAAEKAPSQKSDPPPAAAKGPDDDGAKATKTPSTLTRFWNTLTRKKPAAEPES